jgi:hypothetical protein
MKQSTLALKKPNTEKLGVGCFWFEMGRRKININLG